MADLAKQIRARLEALRREVAELEIAITVIDRIQGGNVLPAPAEQQPFLTVRRVQPPLLAGTAPAKKKNKPRDSGPRVKHDINWAETATNVLRDQGRPMTSGEIVDILDVRDDPKKKQAVYNALSVLKLAGHLGKDGQFYSLIGQPSPASVGDASTPTSPNDQAEAA